MMHGNDHLSHDSGSPHFEPDLSAPVLRVAGAASISFVLATFLPSALLLMAMSQFLSVSALAAAIVALLLREPINAPRVTRWDEAAILFAAALLVGFFVDSGSVAATLQSLSHAASHGAAPPTPPAH